MQREIEKVFRDIIINYVDVDAENVWIQDQNNIIPADEDKLFISIGVVDALAMNNNREVIPTDDGMTEIQTTVMLENIQLDFFSRDNQARTKWQQAIMAMQSVYSQQQQELYNFKIARIPRSVANTSEVEGTSRLNRFSIVIPCHVWYRKEVVISSTDYYDDFSTRVDDETTAGEANGLIEFNITES